MFSISDIYVAPSTCKPLKRQKVEADCSEPAPSVEKCDFVERKRDSPEWVVVPVPSDDALSSLLEGRFEDSGSKLNVASHKQQ